MDADPYAGVASHVDKEVAATCLTWNLRYTGATAKSPPLGGIARLVLTQPGGDFLLSNRVSESRVDPWRAERAFARKSGIDCLAILAALCLLAQHLARSEDTESVAQTKSQVKQGVESELIVEGLASYGIWGFLPEAKTASSSRPGSSTTDTPGAT